MYRFLKVTKNIITLSDIKHTDGFNPVIINFGMFDKNLARALMVKALAEYLGITVSEEYAETAINNYDANNPYYVEQVIKDIRRMFYSNKSNSNKSNKKNNYVFV